MTFYMEYGVVEMCALSTIQRARLIWLHLNLQWNVKIIELRDYLEGFSYK